jgi:uncharacterized alkaline shock family protein YloU
MDEESIGKTTIAPEVLVTIVRMAVLGVPGVSRLAPISGGINNLFRKGSNEGVRVQIEDGVAYLDIFLILLSGFNAREVSRQVQSQVARSVSEMLGMDVGHINIHIENIDYSD